VGKQESNDQPRGKEVSLDNHDTGTLSLLIDRLMRGFRLEITIKGRLIA
jgi:hypothetical protein